MLLQLMWWAMRWWPTWFRWTELCAWMWLKHMSFLIGRWCMRRSWIGELMSFSLMFCHPRAHSTFGH